MGHLEGEIFLDNVNILTDTSLNLSRSVISIIPQDPTLFSGSFRSNLDPFDKFSDDDLWNSLEKVQLSSKVAQLTNQLDSKVSEGGKNLSIGEKQLLCLARAILKKSQIIVIDEATANVDNETDECIQTTLKAHFKTCTMLIIAHRLNTIINSDKILVIDKGTIAEYGPPNLLLEKRGHFFNLLNGKPVTQPLNFENESEKKES